MKALNLETKNQARDQGIIQLKDWIYFKLVPRKLDLGPSSKVGLNIFLTTCQCLHQGSQRIKPSKFYILYANKCMYKTSNNLWVWNSYYYFSCFWGEQSLFNFTLVSPRLHINLQYGIQNLRKIYNKYFFYDILIQPSSWFLIIWIPIQKWIYFKSFQIQIQESSSFVVIGIWHCSLTLYYQCKEQS
jgi:hypothetical protein